MMRDMALIAANRLTVTIPGPVDEPPADEVARARIARWLEDAYGYRPPVASVEPHGWSAHWEVAGRVSPGWKYEAVIPRHLGPARADVAKGRHPASGGSTHRPRRRPVPASAPGRAGVVDRTRSLVPHLPGLEDLGG